MPSHAVLDHHAPHAGVDRRLRLLLLVIIVLAALLIWPSRAGGFLFF